MAANIPDKPILLTHDVVRRAGGPWRCVNCNREGITIRDINIVPCPNQGQNNVLKAIENKL